MDMCNADGFNAVWVCVYRRCDQADRREGLPLIAVAHLPHLRGLLRGHLPLHQPRTVSTVSALPLLSRGQSAWVRASLLRFWGTGLQDCFFG